MNSTNSHVPDEWINSIVRPEEERKQETEYVPIERLHPFPGHPFKVEDNPEMNALSESIREQGILSPLLVRKIENTNRESEPVSGVLPLFQLQERTGNLRGSLYP